MSSHLIVCTKADLPAVFPVPSEAIAVSAKSGLNLDRLREKLDELAFASDAPGSTLALTARHLHFIDDARLALRRARQAVEQSSEFVAADLRSALDSLGQILGTLTPDDILGKIFSSFCIGK